MKKTQWDRFSCFYDLFTDIVLKSTYIKIYDEIQKDIEYGWKIAEIGTGTGEIALAASAKAAIVKASDLSVDMLKIAKKKAFRKGITNVDFSVRDIYSLKYKEGIFDAVIAANIIHLLGDPDRALKNVIYSVKKGGKVILPTFLHGNGRQSAIFSKVMQGAGFKEANGFDRADFISLLKRSGLIIEKEFIIKGIPDLCYLTAIKK